MIFFDETEHNKKLFSKKEDEKSKGVLVTIASALLKLFKKEK